MSEELGIGCHAGMVCTRYFEEDGSTSEIYRVEGTLIMGGKPLPVVTPWFAHSESASADAIRIFREHVSNIKDSLDEAELQLKHSIGQSIAM